MVEKLPVGKVEALDDEVDVDLEVVPVGALAELAPQDGLPDAPGGQFNRKSQLVFWLEKSPEFWLEIPYIKKKFISL